MRSGLPSGTVTFLFTDIEGSTKLLRELGDGYADALAEHRRVLREAFQTNGGVEVDTQGDAFFIAFATAKDAVVAASEAQSALASGPIRVRMGLHTGEPQLSEEGYVGLAVHEGARIAACSHGGQVVLSRQTKELAGDGFAFLDLGEHRVKDFSEPVWIYQLGSERFPPLKTISNTNLPRPASSFVGRERELEEVVFLLQDSARLLTLSGPGGSGKTRLAIEAAAELVPNFKSGVFWVGLAALRDPTLVTETIAQTLGAKDGLAEHIGERELLLLLDNLEQVVEAAPELSELLSACSNLRLLVTSRELLRIQGEVEYAVPPLAEQEAVDLFCARSRLEIDETIAELCRRLDNLPLAVELAAARTSVLSPAQILERLSQRLDLLKGGRDAEARQQTLRATIEWSHELLSAEEQRLFARLAVFAGGCTLDAAEEVCGADLDTLQSLVEKSLVRHTGERFWMLETIREYALERLKESGHAKELHARHASEFKAIAEEQADALSHQLLEPDLDNLRSALAWLQSCGEPEEVLSLGSALEPLWLRRGYFQDATNWLDRAPLDDPHVPSVTRAAALSAAGLIAFFVLADGQRAERFTHESLALYRQLADDGEAAWLLNRLGGMAHDRGKSNEALQFHREALETFEALDDDRGRANSLHLLGETARDQGRLDEAAQLLEEAAKLSRRANDSAHLAATLHSLGDVDLDRDDQPRALAWYRESLRLGTQAADPRSQLYCLAGIAAGLTGIGRPRDGARLWGFVEANEERLGFRILAHERRRYEAWADRMWDELGAATFSAARSEGEALRLDEVVEEALALD